MKIEKVYRKDLNGWRWKIDITIAGERIRRADFPTQREAIEAIAALQSLARARRFGLAIAKPKTTLKELHDRFSKDRKAKDNPRVIQILDEFIETIGSEKQIASLSRADWKIYTDLLKSRDLQPGTVNRYLAVISRTLNTAPELFPALEEWRCPKIPWERKPLGRDRVLSQEEISRILHALLLPHWPRERQSGQTQRQEIYDLFRLMLLTGAREGELLHLKQSAIIWHWKAIQIESKKGGGLKRVVPLSNLALEILETRKTNAPRVFKSMPATAIHHVFTRSDTLTGVPYGEKADNGWILYDARHCAGTVMESAGIPYSAVSAILGHKRKDQTATYTHAQLSVMKKAIETLETWCREIDGFISGIRNQKPVLASDLILAKR